MATLEQPDSSTARENLLTRSVSGWAKLYVFGNSKVVQSSVIWVIITPLCAKLLNAIYAHFNIALPLPTNFLLLYFGAALFAIASVLYALFAPAIFKHAPTYSAFMLGQHSHLELKHWFHDLAKFKKNGETVIDAKRIQSFLVHLNGNANLTAPQGAEVIEGVAHHALLDPFWGTVPSSNALPFLYEITAKVADQVHPNARLVASICYWFGFSLVGAVAILNTIAMGNYLIRTVF